MQLLAHPPQRENNVLLLLHFLSYRESCFDPSEQSRYSVSKVRPAVLNVKWYSHVLFQEYFTCTRIKLGFAHRRRCKRGYHRTNDIAYFEDRHVRKCQSISGIRRQFHQRRSHKKTKFWTYTLEHVFQVPTFCQNEKLPRKLWRSHRACYTARHGCMFSSLAIILSDRFYLYPATAPLRESVQLHQWAIIFLSNIVSRRSPLRESGF